MGAFPLVPLFQNFQKWPICVSLTNLLYLTSACTFRAAVSAKKFSKDCTLSPYLLAESAICADVTLEALNSNYFLGAFPLVPPLQNFKKKGRFGCPFPICFISDPRALLEPQFALKSSPGNVL